jgi:hypothetical protein
LLTVDFPVRRNRNRTLVQTVQTVQVVQTV